MAPIEPGQPVEICLPFNGKNHTRLITFGVVQKTNVSGRFCIIECDDGKTRYLSPAVLRVLTPLEVIARAMDDS